MRRCRSARRTLYEHCFAATRALVLAEYEVRCRPGWKFCECAALSGLRRAGFDGSSCRARVSEWERCPGRLRSARDDRTRRARLAALAGSTGATKRAWTEEKGEPGSYGAAPPPRHFSRRMCSALSVGSSALASAGSRHAPRGAGARLQTLRLFAQASRVRLGRSLTKPTSRRCS